MILKLINSRNILNRFGVYLRYLPVDIRITEILRMLPVTHSGQGSVVVWVGDVIISDAVPRIYKLRINAAITLSFQKVSARKRLMNRLYSFYSFFKDMQMIEHYIRQMYTGVVNFPRVIFCRYIFFTTFGIGFNRIRNVLLKQVGNPPVYKVKLVFCERKQCALCKLLKMSFL